MPGYLLHVGATVMCLHGGPAQPSQPNPRVRVAGRPVVTTATSYTVTGCPFNVSGASSPCVAAHWQAGATRVRAGGRPVLLQDSQASCVPNGTGVRIDTTQTRVRGT